MGTKLSVFLASASTIAMMSGVAIAQEDVSRQDTVVVTGSRIPTDPNLVSSVPVQSVDSEDIKLSGEINLADVVNDIPALISSLTSDQSAIGSNALNLRGLGAERTLTLVNGRRHVAGFRGTQAVDIGSIPRALVERVEVTTGGASAVYGSDAVTGVVNFILKDDFEGFEATGTYGVSGQGDGETYALDMIFGTNFDNDRGNVVATFSVERDTGLSYGDRDWSKDNGIATTQANPALRFQPGEIGGADTPYFNSVYGTFGSLIPTTAPAGVTLTAAEQALIDRAATSPARVVLENPPFWLTSQAGSVAPGFGGRGTTYIDVNNNGIPDCQESRGGQDSFLAGCWVTNPDGSIRVFEEGLIASGGLWGAGGDGGGLNFNRDSLIPKTDKYVANLNAKYDLEPDLTVFFEGKYVYANAETFGEQDTYYDTLEIQFDNPYVPAELAPVMNQVGYLVLTQDPLDFSDNNPTSNERETYRAVAGLEWRPTEDHTMEISINHGNFTYTQNSTSIYLDRLFAAFDATTDANGNIVCRSDLNPNAFYPIDYFTWGNGFGDGSFYSNTYASFTPGDGQCKPLNPFGTYSVSEAAQNFVTTPITSQLELEQTVLSYIAYGQFDVLDVVLDGPLGYAAGAEYRKETSDNQLDPTTLGVLPEGTPFTAGANINDFVPYLNSLTSIDNVKQFNTAGNYDVHELFAEIRLPIFVDRPFAREFALDAAFRRADYSTSGVAETWKVGLSWAPIQDISFRATISEAIRAPNITELFDPALPITIAATADPCDPGNVGLGTANREPNCIADLQAAGVPLSQIVDGSGNYIWNNPLTGRFAGTSGGNPDLEPETSESVTIGAVFQPSFLENFTLTVDYWDIEIENAISAVGTQDILDGCLDSASYPGVPFCSAFVRRGDGGLSDLTTGQINFAKQAATGVDFSAAYSFDFGANTFGARLVGSYQEKLDNFFNPLDLTEVNSDIGEIQLPELSGNLTLSWDRGPFSAALQTTYMDRQTVATFSDLQTHLDTYGAGAYFDETYIFDLNGSYEFSDKVSFFGGVNNIADEEPFATQTAWPVGPRGRYFFAGFSYTH